MDIKLIEQVKRLGLQFNEARVYLALLEIGKGGVSEISKASQINRTTGYDILERLCTNGFISKTVLGKKNVYVAEPPVRLRQYLEKEKRLINNRLEKLDSFYDDLQFLYKTDTKPGIKFYEGRMGIKNAYGHTLDAKSDIYSILDIPQYIPDFYNFGKEYAKDRTKLKVRELHLVVPSQEAQKFWDSTYKGNKERQKYTEYRWLKHEFLFSLATEVMIFDDKVISVLFKPGENVAFEVTSQSFANSLKVLFEIVWTQSKPFE